MLSKVNITVTPRFLHYTFEIIIGVQNMHKIELFYVNKKNVQINIHKFNRLTLEHKHTQKYLSPVGSS